MSLNARSIAVKGFGYGVLAVALSGFSLAEMQVLAKAEIIRLNCAITPIQALNCGVTQSVEVESQL